MPKYLIAVIMLFAITVSMPLLAQESTWTCPAGFEGQSLNMINWTTYIAPNTISNFEDLCGVNVTYDTFDNIDSALTQITNASTAYDVVVLGASDTSRMIDDGLLAPLNRGNIPNIANISPDFLGLTFDPENTFSLPYQWGTIGIGYNTARIPNIQSWEDLFQYNGPVSWLNNDTATIGIALLMLGFDPNSDNPDEIAQARDFLVQNSGNVIYINDDDGQDLLAVGDADLVVEYSGDIFQLIRECDCEDFAFVIPAEGTNFWVDSMVIPASASNPALAAVFMDYILDANVSAEISNFTAFGTPNQAAMDAGLIDDDLLTNPNIYPDQETLDRLFPTITNAQQLQLFADAWDEIRILIGQ